MEDVLTELYEVVTQRHENPQEGSYTCYLFDQGLDKILKKVGEESAETIIAAKNGIKEDTVGEISDLLFHLVVMMKNEGITHHTRRRKGGAVKASSKIREPQKISSGG